MFSVEFLRSYKVSECNDNQEKNDFLEKIFHLRDKEVKNIYKKESNSYIKRAVE